MGRDQATYVASASAKTALAAAVQASKTSLSLTAQKGLFARGDADEAAHTRRLRGTPYIQQKIARERPKRRKNTDAESRPRDA